MPLPRRQKSIYFLNLNIENARCFTETQELHLVDSKGRPAQWTLLVGDNGVGKSTLLQCLAWMRPTPYYPAGENKQAGIQPWLYDQDPPIMIRLLRDRASRTVLQAELVEVPDLVSCHSSTKRVRTGIEIRAKNNKFTGAKLTVNEPATTVEPFVITYAANRHMGHQNADELSDSEPVDLLQTDSTELVDAADVLSKPKFQSLSRISHCISGGYWISRGVVNGYIRGDTPSSSKQRCCTGVGCVCKGKLAAVSATCIVLTVSVPRSVSSVRKLCTGRSSAVRLRDALARAAGERLAGATTERRRCSPACGSWSSKSSGASF